MMLRPIEPVASADDAAGENSSLTAVEVTMLASCAATALHRRVEPP
jgi:hypothetical protein